MPSHKSERRVTAYLTDRKLYIQAEKLFAGLSSFGRLATRVRRRTTRGVVRPGCVVILPESDHEASSALDAEPPNDYFATRHARERRPYDGGCWCAGDWQGGLARRVQGDADNPGVRRKAAYRVRNWRYPGLRALVRWRGGDSRRRLRAPGRRGLRCEPPPRSRAQHRKG